MLSGPGCFFVLDGARMQLDLSTLATLGALTGLLGHLVTTIRWGTRIEERVSSLVGRFDKFEEIHDGEGVARCKVRAEILRELNARITELEHAK